MGGGNNAGHARRRTGVLVPAAELRRVGRAATRSSSSSAFADAHPRAAVVGPRLRNPDGSLQRSVRGEPTLWRLATEYLVPPQARAAHRRRSTPSTAAASTTTPRREVESLYGRGAARPARGDRRGRPLRRGVLHVQRGDRLAPPFPARPAGRCWFTPAAEVTHLGGASHGGRLYVENLRGILRFLAKNRGAAGGGARAAAAALVAAAAGARSSAASAGSATATACASWSRATSRRCSRDRRVPAARVRDRASCCFPASSSRGRSGSGAPRRALAWALRARSSSPGPSCSPSTARSGSRPGSSPGSGSLAGLFAVRGLAQPVAAAPEDEGPDPVAWGRRAVGLAGVVFGLVLWHVEGAVTGDALFHEARVRKLVELGHLHLRSVDELVRRRPPPRLRLPALARLPRARREGVGPRSVGRRCTARPRCSSRSRSSSPGRRASPSSARRPAGVSVLAASVALYCFAAGHGGSYVSLALPATASRQLLVPAAFALFFTYCGVGAAGRPRRRSRRRSARSRSSTRPTRSSR